MSSVEKEGEGGLSLEGYDIVEQVHAYNLCVYANSQTTTHQVCFREMKFQCKEKNVVQEYASKTKGIYLTQTEYNLCTDDNSE